MHTDVGREREMVDAQLVRALLDEKGLEPIDAAVLVKKSLSTIYGWQKRGIEYLDWIGLLALLGERPDWQPGQKHVDPS